MLIRFEVSNFRSIADPAELSMVAIDRDRPEARAQEMLSESLLPVAAVYGPNASGKSNLIEALEWLGDAVEHSLRWWGEVIPIEPFAFGAGPSKSSCFNIDSMVDGVRFEYVLEVDNNRVFYEGLFHYPEKKRRRIFEREGGELKIQRGLGELAGTRELLTDRTLALSVARRFNEELVSKFAREIVGIRTLGQRPAIPSARAILQLLVGTNDEATLATLDSSAEDREQVLALLRLADLGIEDVVVDTQEGTQRQRVRLVHSSKEERLPLEFAAESGGTQTWFNLIGPVLSALRRGSLVLFDELDASLHPTLSAELIRLFHSPTTNPLGAQLVFTSHDTSLLNHLNRDEVWLTEKGPDGSTRLGALSEFAGERVRKSQNLENAYLHGRFGALPQIDQAAFLRALGLIG